MRALKLVAAIEQVENADDLEEAGDYVRWWVGRMVEAGYHPVAAEGFAAQGRRAVADAQVRLGVQRDAPGLPKSEAGPRMRLFQNPAQGPDCGAVELQRDRAGPRMRAPGAAR
ncbi:hypothetical protein SAMN04515675_0005 [Pseudomonas costantinii]|uniref:Polyvalent protein metallopeptidase domain-containing protein n=1 Tax=Pseudomonas costantinii TaxID=168469 RepID=A0A1H4TZT2_9PSED|nr:hypothetical protein SAMN04515675_0005 [Pseudomonas costantinii]